MKLGIRTTAHLQHSRPLYSTGHVLGACCNAPDTQVMARKRVSRVSRKAPFLPSKQTHTPSPSGANFQPPFFCCYRYGLTLTLSGNKRIGELRTITRISAPMPPFCRELAQVQPPTHILDPKLINFYAEVFHLCVEIIG